ncbi:MAG: hypothetical protein Q8O76_01935 [Chloroflexota bacterium]|nr:hypothetical protein [Chloroflexota bacterium]
MMFRLLAASVVVAILVTACAIQASAPTPTPPPRPPAGGIHTPDDVRAQYESWPDGHKFSIDEDVVVMFSYPHPMLDFAGFAFIKHIPSVSSVTLNRPGWVVGPGGTKTPMYLGRPKWYDGQEVVVRTHYNSEEGERRLEKVLADKDLMRRILGHKQPSTPTATPTPPTAPRETAELNGVTYRAEMRMQKAIPTADVSPVMLRATVIIANTNDRSVEVPLEGCAVSLRLYEEPSRTATPVWTSEGYRERMGGRCMQDPYAVALRPGESYEVGDAIDAGLVLNDSVPPGRYYFAIIIKLSGGPLELAAGEGELSYDVDGLAFRAETSLVDVAPRKLQTVVMVTNTSDKRVHIQFGACSVWLRAYTSPDRSGVPAWDARKRPNPDPVTGAYWVCPSYLSGEELGPGESATPKEFRKLIEEPDIMGDALPDGRYYFSATIEVNNTSVDIPAGELELSRTQAPLPSVRTVDGIRYEARTELMQGSPPKVQTTLRVTNVSRSPIGAKVPRDCPIILYAYQDEARRDAAFRSGEPDWRPQERCYLVMDRFMLSPGESREFETQVSASEALGESLLPGRYYFVAAVYNDGSTIVLSAGEADLKR